MRNTLIKKIMEPFLHSRDGIIIEVNKEFVNFTGFTMDELLGKSLIEIGNLLKINPKILLDSISSQCSGYLFTKSLNAREVSISFLNGIETNEKIYTFVEKLNSRLEDKLIFIEQTFTDNIQGLAVYSVPDLILLKANQKYLDFLQPSFNKEENSIGRSINEIVTGFVGSQVEVIWDNVLETQKTSSTKEFRYNKLERGITNWDSILTPISEWGELKYIFVTTNEVTENILNKQSIKRQNEIIKEQKEFLNRMIDTLNLPIIRLSCPYLRIVDINKKAFNIIKSLRPNVSLIGQIKDMKVEDLFKIFKSSEYKHCVSGVLKEKKTTYLNKEKQIINGEEVYWNIIFEPMLDVNGEIQEILILIIDVTPEIKSNLIIEKALKSQEELIVNISHELKTPLNVIYSTVQLLKLYYSNGSLDENKDSVIKYIDSMKQNCYRLTRLINNIVDTSKIEAGYFVLNLSNNNIVEVIEEIVMSVTNYTESKGINIIFDMDIEVKVIACDPEKIERIVLNLLSNAIKFSEFGDEILVEVKDKNEFVEISVKDNGIGMEEKDLKMIFDRFKQLDSSLSRNSEGMGIGLSLVKSIIELHGGSIYVESELGKGSKFTVMLPSNEVFKENMLYKSKMRSKNENIRVELSDISS